MAGVTKDRTKDLKTLSYGEQVDPVDPVEQTTFYKTLERIKGINPLNYIDDSFLSFRNMVYELEGVDLKKENLTATKQWLLCRAYIKRLIQFFEFSDEENETLYMAFGYLEGYEQIGIGERRKKYKEVVSPKLADSSIDGTYGKIERELEKVMARRLAIFVQAGKTLGLLENARRDVEDMPEFGTKSEGSNYFKNSRLANHGKEKNSPAQDNATLPSAPSEDNQPKEGEQADPVENASATDCSAENGIDIEADAHDRREDVNSRSNEGTLDITDKAALNAPHSSPESDNKAENTEKLITLKRLLFSVIGALAFAGVFALFIILMNSSNSGKRKIDEDHDLAAVMQEEFEQREANEIVLPDPNGTWLERNDVNNRVLSDPVLLYMIAGELVDINVEYFQDSAITIEDICPSLLEYKTLTDDALALPENENPRGFEIWVIEDGESGATTSQEYKHYANDFIAFLDEFELSYERFTATDAWQIESGDDYSTKRIGKEENWVEAKWLILTYSKITHYTFSVAFSLNDMQYMVFNPSYHYVNGWVID